MAIDFKAELSNPAKAIKFCGAFIEAYLSPAFGTLSKSEIDLLVFSCLIEAGVIDPEAAIYDISRALNISPSKVRNLLANWQWRTNQQSNLQDAIVAALRKTRFSKDGTLLTFGIESPLVKEEIIARLKKKGVYPDASFSKEVVRLPVEAFVEFLDDIVDENTKAQVKATLIKDKQLADTSFKAVVTRVVAKLGEKLAGEAGKEIAGKIAKTASEKLTGFLTGLLLGNAASATKNITEEDLIEV